MDRNHLLSLLPNMQMIGEALVQDGVAVEQKITNPDQAYRGVRLYRGQKPLQLDLIYLLRQTQTDFPVDQYAYIAVQSIPGRGNHLCCPGQEPEVLLDFLLELFARFQEIEERIDQLTYCDGGLQELCELGARLLDNPVCIHDDWFIMTAMSQSAEQLMMPEYVTAYSKGTVPRVIIEEFKHDSEYLETYANRGATIWKAVDGDPDSLYVNLWDGTLYRGRFLVIQQNRPFCQRDFILAEVLAQRAMMMLGRKQPGEAMQYQSMDDIVFALLRNQQPDPADLLQFLKNLKWDSGDQFVIVRLKSQQSEEASVMEHMLHSDLFRQFPGGYILLTGREQCLILNQNIHTASASQLHHQLAPLCRDYCLYAGISSPVQGLRNLHAAYYQAQVALQQAFRLHSEKWILDFSQCVLDQLLDGLTPPLQPVNLVAPELLQLIKIDREMGTQYFETLREYLLQERHVPRTAQNLIIHRTTLLYRLKKIESLVSLNLEDPWQRLYLVLSLWILNKLQQ